ncbi:MAG: hypothetical protein H7A44_05320 [Opitutaceae bacterium]|nr:hypothetical protein [Cephaloticoccus sp.]MCP5529843.1 hypothetical protein [Opitutaceae bacterium]
MPCSVAPEILIEFIRPQQRDFGANHEIAEGLWAVFALPVGDAEANALARELLADAPFPHETGTTEDDSHELYYVTTAHRHAATHWLEDLVKTAAGEVRPVSPEQQHLIDQVLASETPHRAARQLAEAHEAGTVTAGLIRRTETVRALLDRLHGREPLFYGALQMLLNHHLVDMLVLFRQLIGEDVGLLNEIVKGGLSRDPFLQTRQDATSEIRNHLIRFRIINPMDQMKNTGLGNPYAAFMEVAVSNGQIIAPVDGIKSDLARSDFIHAIHSIRRKLYQGESFSAFGTQSPWMTERIALPFKFIRQKLEARADLSPLDALYMLERSAAE